MKRTLLSLTLLFAAALASAQFDFPVSQPKFTLVSQPKIQEHLKPDDDQTKKVKSILGGIVQDDGNGHTFIQINGETDMDQIDKDVIAVLDKVQLKLFSELYVQRNGYTALSRKEYAEKLSITEEQKKKLEEVWQHHRDRIEKLFSDNGIGSRELKLEEEDLTKLNAETSKEVEAILTKAQIDQWKGFHGAKFDIGD